MALFFKRQMEDTLYVTHQTRGGVQHVLSNKKCVLDFKGWVGLLACQKNDSIRFEKCFQYCVKHCKSRQKQYEDQCGTSGRKIF